MEPQTKRPRLSSESEAQALLHSEWASCLTKSIAAHSRNEGLLDSVTVVAGETEYLMNALLLAQCDPLRAMLTSGLAESNKRRITLPMTTRCWEALSEYLSCGSLPIDNENATELLRAAHMYDMPGVGNFVEGFLIENSSIYSALCLYELSDTLDRPKLRGAMHVQLSRSPLASLVTASTTEAQIRAVLQRDALSDAEEEVERFKVLCRWASDGGNEEAFRRLVTLIRFPTMTGVQLCEHVEPSAWMEYPAGAALVAEAFRTRSLLGDCHALRSATSLSLLPTDKDAVRRRTRRQTKFNDTDAMQGVLWAVATRMGTRPWDTSQIGLSTKIVHEFSAVEMCAKGAEIILAAANDTRDFCFGSECLARRGTYAEVTLPCAVQPTGFSYGWGHCSPENWKSWSFQAYSEASSSWIDLYVHDEQSVHSRFSLADLRDNIKYFDIASVSGDVYTRFRILSRAISLACFHPRSLEVYGAAVGITKALMSFGKLHEHTDTRGQVV